MNPIWIFLGIVLAVALLTSDIWGIRLIEHFSRKKRTLDKTDFWEPS